MLKLRRMTNIQTEVKLIKRRPPQLREGFLKTQ